MTLAVTQTYRTIVAMAADLDMTIQAQEIRGWEFVTAFPPMRETDGYIYADEGDMPGETPANPNGDASDRAQYVLIFRKRYDHRQEAAFYS